ncbi:MAG: fasciclin domain-containing protein [Pyrinomonadaceae bacterium]|nr:fasciclin domain-containing protein [Pyrinomonadaceae bacterium]
MKTRITLILSICIAAAFALACAEPGAKKATGDDSKSVSKKDDMNDQAKDDTGKKDDEEMEKKDNPKVGGAEMSMEKDIVDNAANSKDHTTLVAAVKAAGLVETLKGDGPFTVFAPTNAAFEKLPKGTVDTLLKPENKEKLKGILTYHVVAGKFDAKAVGEAIKKGDGKASLKTVAGGEITASMDGEKVVITDAKGGKSTVTIADVYQKNGVIHVVDSVMLPE